MGLTLPFPVLPSSAQERKLGPKSALHEYLSAMPEKPGGFLYLQPQDIERVMGQKDPRMMVWATARDDDKTRARLLFGTLLSFTFWHSRQSMPWSSRYAVEHPDALGLSDNSMCFSIRPVPLFLLMVQLTRTAISIISNADLPPAGRWAVSLVLSRAMRLSMREDDDRVEGMRRKTQGGMPCVTCPMHMDIALTPVRICWNAPRCRTRQGGGR